MGNEPVFVLLLVEIGSFRLYPVQHTLDLFYFLHSLLHQVSFHIIHLIQLARRVPQHIFTL